MNLIVYTCSKTLSGEVIELPEVKNLIIHIGEELEEVKEALIRYATDPTPKNKAKLGEELGDVMTMAGTALEGVGRMEDTPNDFAQRVIKLVGEKTYIRGYR